MPKNVDFETTALNVVRTARQTCEQFGHAGHSFLGFADWLETQIPRARHICNEMVRVAAKELSKPASLTKATPVTKVKG